MYCSIRFSDNSYQPGEHAANPRNLAITPGRIAQLTAEGQAVSMHQSDGYLYYPDLADGVMPLEYHRGIDINDCFEASQKSSAKVKEFVKFKSQEQGTQTNHQS